MKKSIIATTIAILSLSVSTFALPSASIDDEFESYSISESESINADIVESGSAISFSNDDGNDEAKKYGLALRNFQKGKENIIRF